MNTRKIKILGTGKYLPKKVVYSSEIDHKLGLPEGWTQKKSGVSHRHYVETESTSEMGANAAREAVRDAGLKLEDIDCIVSASGTSEQPIPCTAALIKIKLEMGNSNIPCFDINSTCLSFVTALDLISFLVHQRKYNKVLIISSEIASPGLNWKQKESCILFGDGAAAVVVGRSEDHEQSEITSSLTETYVEGASYTEIRGGGTRLPATMFNGTNLEEYLFNMNGRAIFKLSSKVINRFMDRLFESTPFSRQDIHMVIPHQASGLALRIMRQKLGYTDEKFMNIISTHGNVIAASIPMALHESIKQNKIQRGDKLLLLGTSAGLSLGGMALVY
ncbi:3-oxoacyl-[acyl-carrier-protein] synthase-3 [Paenibacillus forsythiae]|uniref:3-oxoacyl-[acyl-carrier-protein] synthase-3 n=1 Tax=Paenibacillus forsythiae TaxID=365616 RepID=A0ABU3H1Q5_9BACL|nr:beta-ketoacyl-ACP synthase III [Paenibacillus forsythiae]MDT3424754.1 3-oxoacyl-[acyl-carrier-protein] synthase-3 [Paenibacillus forsythiae]